MSAPMSSTESEDRQICLVCGGVANGYHFGAMSCAACNAFFRRSIAEKRKYICRKDGACEINPNARCFCRACRLKKCFVVGMDSKAVQPHRDVIGRKAKKRPPNEPSPTLPSVVTKVEAAPLVAPDSLRLTNVSNSAFSIPTTNVKPISAPPAQPNSPNSFAEQLLAFSRNPVIATVPAIPTASDFIDLTPHPIRDIYSNIAIDTSRPTTSVQPFAIPQPQYTYEELRPVVQHGHNPYALSEAPIKPVSPSPPPPQSQPEAEDSNLIQEMAIAYRRLVERRRMINCAPTLRDIIGGSGPVLQPSIFGSGLRKDAIRVQIALVVELVNSISPFSMLSVADKILVFRNVSVPFNLLEKHYITMQCGGLENERIIQADFTYVDVSENATYNIMTDLANNQRNPFLEADEMRRIVLPALRMGLDEITKPMYHLGMTDIEFVALVLIVLLNPDIKGLSPTARATISAARNRLYKDWFAYYEKNGVSDGPLKVGNSLLILPALQSAVEKVTSNFHMVRVFGLVDYDRILDDVFK